MAVVVVVAVAVVAVVAVAVVAVALGRHSRWFEPRPRHDSLPGCLVLMNSSNIVDAERTAFGDLNV